MQKVSHGQSFRTALRAETWNSFIDAAEGFKARQMNRGARGEDLSDDTVLVRNTSGYDVPRYGVVWLQSTYASDGDSTWEVLIAKRPTCPFISQLGIAAEPMEAGVTRLFRCWTRGHHPALLDPDLLVVDYPKFAVTQRESFKLACHHGSWGVPVIASYLHPDASAGVRMVSLPIVPPPMVRIRLTSEQAQQVGVPYIGATGPTYFDAAFLSFPDSDLREINSYGLSVE